MREIQTGYKERHSHTEKSQAAEQVPREVVWPPSLEAFKARPDKTHSNLVSPQDNLF